MAGAFHQRVAPSAERFACGPVCGRESQDVLRMARERRRVCRSVGALDMSVDNLVVAAFKRALKNSDTLLTFLLRCHRPAVYNISSRVEQVTAEFSKLNPSEEQMTIYCECMSRA